MRLATVSFFSITVAPFLNSSLAGVLHQGDELVQTDLTVFVLVDLRNDLIDDFLGN